MVVPNRDFVAGVVGGRAPGLGLVEVVAGAKRRCCGRES